MNTNLRYHTTQQLQRCVLRDMLTASGIIVGVPTTLWFLVTVLAAWRAGEPLKWETFAPVERLEFHNTTKP